MLNFEKYSKPSFEIFDESQSLDVFGEENNEVQAILYNYKTYDYTLNENNIFFIKKHLIELDKMFDVINLEQFMHDTTLEPLIQFDERLETFNTRWAPQHIVRYLCDIDNDYKPSITNKYNWKRGIYDYMRAMVDLHEKRHMRNSGIETFFNRIMSNRWQTNNFYEAFVRLDNARKRAKEAVGEVINIDDISLRYDKILEEITTNTQSANQMSDNFNIYNYISIENNNFNDMNIKKHLSIKLITVVECEPKTMDIVLTSGSKIGEMLLPKTYLSFERALYKTLMGNPKNHIVKYGSCPGGRHPYISGYGGNWYDRNNSDSGRSNRISGENWYGLCLSSFQDDIENSLVKNDYQSMIMGISGWNSIYNIEQTNPHNQPRTLFYQSGFNFGNNHEKDIETLYLHVAFNKDKCFKQQLKDCIRVQDDARYRTYDSMAGTNPSIIYYGKEIANNCDIKQCPFRDKCDNYHRVKDMLYNDELSYMVESVAGHYYQHHDEDRAPFIGDDKSRVYQSMFYHLLGRYYHKAFEDNDNTRAKEFPTIYDDGLSYLMSEYLYNYLFDSNYWDKPEEKEPEPTEENLSMEDKLVAWSVRTQNNERRSANGR